MLDSIYQMTLKLIKNHIFGKNRFYYLFANSIPVTPLSVRPSSVRQHFQTSSTLKPLGQLNSNFIWRLLRTRERKFVQMVLVT